jgi:hypothetical protein
MDTLHYIPRSTTGEKLDPGDPRAPCDCLRSLPVFESRAFTKWDIWTPCGHVQYLISAGVVPYEGIGETSYRQTWNTIMEFARKHPHLPKVSVPTAVSGPG